MREIAHRAPGRAGGHEGVGAQRFGDLAIADGAPGIGAPGRHGGAPRAERRRVDHHVDAARRDVDPDAIALLDEADRAAFARLGRDVTDAEARRPAGEAPVGDEGANLAEPLAFQKRGRVEHLLHSRTALGPFIDDHHHVAGMDLVARDRVAGRLLRLEDPRRPLELPARFVDAGGLHDAAVLGDIAVEDGQSALLAVGVRDVADAAARDVGVGLGEVLVLREGDLGGDATGGGQRALARLGGRARAVDVVGVDRGAQAGAVNGLHIAVDEAGVVELAEDREDAAGAVHVLDVVRRRRRDLADVGDAAREPIDVGHGELDPRLVGDGQDVQHRVGRAAHRDVERHGVLERLEGRDGAREHAGVAADVVLLGQLDDPLARRLEKLPAARVGGEQGAVPRQRQPERLVEAVHAVGGEHPGARSARRAGGALHLAQLRVTDLGVAGGDHRIDEVELAHHRLAVAAVRAHHLAGLHRPSRNEDGGDVEAHRGHQHARRDLVAVRDADQRVGAVRVHHVLDAVGDEVAARQRVEHPPVPHRDAVVDRDGVELDAPAASRVDDRLHALADVVQVDVARDELREAVGDGDDRLVEIGVSHPGGAPERARPRHVASVRRGAAAVSGLVHAFTLPDPPRIVQRLVTASRRAHPRR